MVLEQEKTSESSTDSKDLSVENGVKNENHIKDTKSTSGSLAQKTIESSSEALPNRKTQNAYTSTKKIDSPPPTKNVDGIRSHPVYEYTYGGNNDKNQNDENIKNALKSNGSDPASDFQQASEVKDQTSKHDAYMSSSPRNTEETTARLNASSNAKRNESGHKKQAPISSGNTLSYDALINIPTEGLMREKSPPDQKAYIDSVKAQRLGHKSEIYDELRYIGQMFTTYLIFEKAGKMYLIDQHAAHEKILFERLLSQYRKSALDRQILLDPILIELSYDIHNSVLKQSDLFEKLGLQIEDFGGQSIVIREIPALLDRSGAEALFRKALDKFGTYNADTVEVGRSAAGKHHAGVLQDRYQGT